jgi:hypothetical protein
MGIARAVIFRLCRRFRLERQSWGRSLGVHFASGLMLATVHAFLCAAAVGQGWMTHEPAVSGASFVKVVATRGQYNFAVYWMIVCAWHAWMYMSCGSGSETRRNWRRNWRMRSCNRSGCN